MDAPKMSFSIFLVIFAFGSVVFVHAQSTTASDAGECVMTASSCQCSEINVPGNCVSHDGNNQCSMHACKPSYRCDCLGYEMCVRSQCSLYVRDENVLSSVTDSFPCHPGPATAICTAFDYVMETAAAVENMYTAAMSANDESSAVMMEAYQIVAEIESDILAINDALKNIGLSRNQMTAEEKHYIETEAQAVISIVADSGKLALEASHEAEKVYRASREVAELRHEIRQALSDEKTVKQALDEAQQSAEVGNVECTQCASLNDELEKARKARKEAIQKAVDLLKTSREQNWNAGYHRDKVLENRSRAAEGKQRVMSKIDEIKKRVIDVSI